MRFVLGNRVMQTPGGTEVHLVTIAEHLQRLGHEALVYAPELGPFADHARRRGVEVHDSLRELPDACDVVFAQDAIVVYDLARRYPAALSVFRICGDVFDFQLAPQLPGVVDLLVVLSDRYARVAGACAVDVPVLRLRVPIDIDRLVSLGPIRAEPLCAVVLGNYDAREEIVRDVWRRHGVDVRRVGGSAQSYDVAAAVADADIVVAKSRAALDAMACGRAVYVYDVFGGDGWVTPQLYEALEADNFAGQATGRVIDAAALADDLAGYRQGMGAVNRDLVLQHHSARDHVIALLSAITERAAHERGPAPLQELARLTAMQWSWEQIAREFRTMHWEMRETTVRNVERARQAGELQRQAGERERQADERARAALEAARCELAAATARASLLEARIAAAPSADAMLELRRQMQSIRATRAWRLVNAYWRLRLRLRRLSSR